MDHPSSWHKSISRGVFLRGSAHVTSIQQSRKSVGFGVNLIQIWIPVSSIYQMGRYTQTLTPVSLGFCIYNMGTMAGFSLCILRWSETISTRSTTCTVVTWSMVTTDAVLTIAVHLLWASLARPEPESRDRTCVIRRVGPQLDSQGWSVSLILTYWVILGDWCHISKPHYVANGDNSRIAHDMVTAKEGDWYKGFSTVPSKMLVLPKFCCYVYSSNISPESQYLIVFTYPSCLHNETVNFLREISMSNSSLYPKCLAQSTQ